VRGSYPGLDRAERKFDSFRADTHGVGIFIEPAVPWLGTGDFQIYNVPGMA